MSDLSDFMENQILEVYFRGATKTGGMTYVALYTVAPSDAGGGTECSYSGYARQPAHPTTPASGWTAASGGSTSNTQLLAFAAVAGGAITVVAAGVFDASSGGNLLKHKTFGAGISYNVGDIPQFGVGQLVLAMQ